MKLTLRLLRAFILGVLLFVIPGYLFGVIGYGSSYGGIVEQIWLDKCVIHLQMLRANCDDPDLQDVLDYTIRRYNKIGPFDVAVRRIWQNPLSKMHVVACNNPLIPGVSIDIEILTWSIHDGTLILLHEAAHDYWPHLHPFIDPLMKKIESL